MSKEGEIFRKLLKAKGLDEPEAAKILKVSPRQVYRYYDSETISRKKKDEFITKLGIDISTNQIVDDSTSIVREDIAEYNRSNSILIHYQLLQTKVQLLKQELSLAEEQLMRFESQFNNELKGFQS